MHTCGRAPAPTGFNARTMASIAAQPVPGSQVAWLQRRMARMPTELLALAGAAVVVVVAINRPGPESAKPEASPVAAATTPATNPDEKVEPVDEATDTGGGEAPVETPPAAASAKQSTAPKTARTPVPSSLPYDPSMPLSYRILHGGDQVLYDIAVLADETGGRLVDVHGKLFTPHSLNESRSFSQLYLILSLIHI